MGGAGNGGARARTRLYARAGIAGRECRSKPTEAAHGTLCLRAALVAPWVPIDVSVRGSRRGALPWVGLLGLRSDRRGAGQGPTEDVGNQARSRDLGGVGLVRQ